DGWYHVMARGLERHLVFEDARDHEHFLELLPEVVERYGLKIHAYVLMHNHYHLLVQTPYANLSRAMQWLNVSYGVWFNRRHGRVGPLFQGRYHAVPIDGEGSWALQASVYLHLNPVRVKGLGLGKRERKAERLGILPPPSPEMVKARLEALRQHPWSSYLDYAGYRLQPPAWLTCEVLWQRAKHRNKTEQASYRDDIEEPLKGGVEEFRTFAEQMQRVVAVGSDAFLKRLRGLVQGNRNEQKALRTWKRLLPFQRVIEVVALEHGESWEQFRDRHGDWGRDVALWLGRRHSGLTLQELGHAAGEMAYPAVGRAVRQIERQRQTDAKLARLIQKLEQQL
ncbi:MAG: transposase, partial [Phycisphaerae bacterium]